MKKIITILTAIATCASMSARMMVYSANDVEFYLKIVSASAGTISADGTIITFVSPAEAKGAKLVVQEFIKADHSNPSIHQVGSTFSVNDKSISLDNGVSYSDPIGQEKEYTLNGNTVTTDYFVSCFAYANKRKRFASGTGDATWSHSKDYTWAYDGVDQMTIIWASSFDDPNYDNSTETAHFQGYASDAFPFTQFEATIGVVTDGTYTIDIIDSWEHAELGTQNGTFINVDGKNKILVTNHPGIKIVVGDSGSSTDDPGNGGGTDTTQFPIYQGDEGTEAKPYLIKTIDDLNKLAADVNSGNGYEGIYFKLENDLDYSGVTVTGGSNFTPIGDLGTAFSGTFDGQGYTISGIRISDPDGFDKAIFGRVVEGTVKNLVVSDCRIEARTGGGIVAALESATIENCHVGSDVTLTGKMYVGGIAAGCNNGEITGCTSAATITGTINSGQKASYLGGIAGATLAGPTGSTLTDNLFLGTIGGDLNEYIGAITGSDDGGNTFTNNAYTCEDYKGVGTAGSITGTDVNGIRKLKNIATCTASVPNPIYHSGYTHNFFYDGTWNDNHGGIEVYDGETLLTYGTDYRFKDMKSLDGGNCENLNENCRVYLEGLGDYTGELYRDVVIVPATVTNESWGSLKWSLDADGNFTISGTGAMNAATTFRNYTWYNYCSYFKTITIGEGITTVAAGAFGGDSNTNPYATVTTVNLPSTLTTIGDNAFAYCTGLTSLTIPASVTTVGANAFNQCNSLDEVYCFADPFTTWEGYETAFKTDPDDSNNKTTFYVTNADDWTTAYPDANVMYVGATPVSYIDENGKEQSCWNYTVLRTNELPDGCSSWSKLPGGWYVVENWNTSDEDNNGVDFYRTGDIVFKGDTHLILCDGAEMSVSRDGDGTTFQSGGTLTIYGQSGGTGTLSVTNTSNNISNGIEAEGSLTINGGIIRASISSCKSYRYAIKCSFGDVVINGGTVTATASGDAYAIFGNNVSILGGTVVANGTIYSENGSVTIAEGMIDCTLSGGTKRVITEGATADATTAAAVNTLLGGQEISISYSRTYTTGSGSGKASTLCLPFDFVANAADGTYATFTKVTETAGVYEVEMTAVADGATLTAGTPYMFVPKVSGKLTQGNSAYTVPLSGFTSAGTETQGSWQFKGTFETKTWPSGQTHLYGFAGKDYYLSSGAQIAADDIGSFRRFDYGTCAAFRCYLLAPGASAARGVSKAGSLPETLKVRLVKADGTTTAIGTMDMRTGEVEFGDDWYDLNGRRLSGEPTIKGVYIHKGKKVKK